MKTIDDYAEQANRQIGRYFGQRLSFVEDKRAYVPFKDWILAHWARFPRTSPEGVGKIIDNQAQDALIAAGIVKPQ